MAIATSGYKFGRNLFGGQGIFGSLNEQLDFADGYFLGKSLGAFLSYKHKRIYACIASDTRTRSLPLESEVIRGLLECGARVLSFSTSPTPLVRFAAIELNAQLAISITGDSLPANYDGVKIFLEGKALDKRRALQLQNIAASGNWRAHEGGRLARSDGIDAYITRLFAETEWMHKEQRGRKVIPSIVFAQSHGSAMNDVLKEIAARLAPWARQVLMVEGLQELRKAMARKQEQIGFFFNSDGSAVQVFDSLGKAVASETLFALLVRNIELKGRRKIIVTDSLFSDSTIRWLEISGIKVLRRARFSSGLLTHFDSEENIVAAASCDGHMVFMDRYYIFEDACNVTLRTLSLLYQQGVGTLEMLLRQKPPSFGSGIIRIAIDRDNRKDALITRLRALVRAETPDDSENLKIDTKVLGRDDGGGSEGESLEVERRFADGRWIVRGAPFEDILLVKSEGQNTESAARAQADMFRMMTACGIADTRAEAGVGLIV